MCNSFMLTTAKQIAVEPVVCLCGDEASLLLGHCWKMWNLVTVQPAESISPEMGET